MHGWINIEYEVIVIKQDGMKFITKDEGLYRDSFVKKLCLENDYYIITVFYMGDYTEDKKMNSISTHNITIGCKIKRSYMPEFVLISDDIEIALDIPAEPMLRLCNAGQYFEKLKLAYDMAKELQAILKSYFINCVDGGGSI